MGESLPFSPWARDWPPVKLATNFVTVKFVPEQTTSGVIQRNLLEI